EAYTRLLLHMSHALARGWGRVETFTFGTRLTRITLQLRERRPDAALAHVSRAVSDWSGGTRIGDALHEFNLRWSRRVLGRGAIRIGVEMKALMISAILLASCSPAASGPTPTPTATGVVPTTAVPTPTPTATVAAGLTRYTNTELGYSVDLPAGWRRAACSEGIITTAPLVASEMFMGVPEAEE